MKTEYISTFLLLRLCSLFACSQPNNELKQLRQMQLNNSIENTLGALKRDVMNTGQTREGMRFLKEAEFLSERYQNVRPTTNIEGLIKAINEMVLDIEAYLSSENKQLLESSTAMLNIGNFDDFKLLLGGVVLDVIHEISDQNNAVYICFDMLKGFAIPNAYKVRSGTDYEVELGVQSALSALKYRYLVKTGTEEFKELVSHSSSMGATYKTKITGPPGKRSMDIRIIFLDQGFEREIQFTHEFEVVK